MLHLIKATLVNGANTSIQLIPGTSFTIGAETNPNPGTPRTTTIDISLAASNTRVTGAGVTTQTITITQA